MRIFIAALMINALSFMVMRVYWRLTGKLSAEIVFPRQKFRTEDEGEVIFLSAGNLAQPRKAFEFLYSKLKRKQYAFLEFKMIGWSARETAKAITKAVWPGNRVTMYAISVGDHVARYLDESPALTQLQIYTINPCPCRRAVRKELRILLTVAAPIFWALCHMIGWLSVIPFIPATGGKYSLVLLADQYMTIAFDKPPIIYAPHTQGVVLSAADELLDNDYLEQVFADQKIARVPTHHGDTVGMAFEYLRGVEKLLELPEE